jgi:hypothetical protein
MEHHVQWAQFPDMEDYMKGEMAMDMEYMGAVTEAGSPYPNAAAAAAAAAAMANAHPHPHLQQHLQHQLPPHHLAHGHHVHGGGGASDDSPAGVLNHPSWVR